MCRICPGLRKALPGGIGSARTSLGDLLARVLYGGRISLLVGVVATGVSLVIGVAYGLVSGYAGGRLDALMMRLVDVLFALPFIVLVIIFPCPWRSRPGG